MTVKTVNLKDFAAEIGKDWELRKQDYTDAVTKGIIDSLPEVVKNSPVDTGLYAQSWDVSPEEDRVLFGNIAPHAPVIEFGARPFRPPLPPLLAWAKRVLKDPSQPPAYSKRVWALAKFTQAKIAREGMRPKSVMQNQIPVIIQNIRRALGEL